MPARDRRRPCRNPLAWTAWTCSTKATWRSTGTRKQEAGRLLRRFGAGSQGPPEQRCVLLGEENCSGRGPPKIIHNRKHYLWTLPSTKQKAAQGAISSNEPFPAPFSSCPQRPARAGGRGRNKQSALLSTAAHYRLPARRRGKKNQTSIQFRCSICYVKLRLCFYSLLTVGLAMSSECTERSRAYNIFMQG